MQLGDDERDELRASARKMLDSQCSSEDVRALMDDVRGHAPALWSAIAELGWLAIHAPEEFGGMGASYTDLAVIIHELGRRVAPTPFLASAVLGTEALLGSSNSAVQSDWLPSILGGERILTVANAGMHGSYSPAGLGVKWSADGGVTFNGVARYVPDAHVANGVVVVAVDDAGKLTAAVVEPTANGLKIEVERTVDQTRRMCKVSLSDVKVSDDQLLVPAGQAAELHARITDVGAIAVAVDSVGAAEHMLEVTSQYAKERMQFGRPIGSFQAVKHHCANMLISVEGSRAACTYATDALDSGGDVGIAASVAKSFAGLACAESNHLAVQVHGGIGFTWEHDAHIYLKRVKLNEALFGTTSWHRRRVGGSLVDA